MNVNPAHKCLFKAYTWSYALAVWPGQIWKQGYHNNVCHFVLRFWLTLYWSLHYFLVFSLNATLWHIFVEHQIGIIFKGVVTIIKLQMYQWLALWGVLHRYLSINCYEDDVIFNFYYFIALPIGKTWLMSLMRFNNRIVYILFSFMAEFKQVFTIF